MTISPTADAVAASVATEAPIRERFRQMTGQTVATVHPCLTFRPLPGQDVCGACRWNGAAHRADTSEPVVTRDGVTTQVAKRAAVLTPNTSGVVLDTAEIREAARGLLAARDALSRAVDQEASYRSAAEAHPTGKGSRTFKASLRFATQDVEAAEGVVKRALSDLERAVRLANRDATEAQLNAALRSL